MRKTTFVIAEAGVNHNGSIDTALALVEAAAEAGADAVKFQTFKAESLVTTRAKLARYQMENMKDAGHQHAMLSRLELHPEHHHALAERCNECSIQFMSTAFDLASLDFVAKLGVPYIKIASGDITAGPLVLHAARLGKPLIVSTGMATLGEIESALSVIAFGFLGKDEPRGLGDFEAAFASSEGQAALREMVTLLHCTTEYPAPFDGVNLAAMDTIRVAFGLPVGYSDHTRGIEVSIAAVARGAGVIEKHFTMDRTSPGPDHAASLEPGELKAMVTAIRNVEKAIGIGTKVASNAERPNRAIARRSIVAARRILQGEVLTAEALDIRRPGDGLSPMCYWSLLGRVAPRNFEIDEPILL